MSFHWNFEFGWEIIDHAHFLAVFGVTDPVKSIFFNEIPNGHFLGWKRIVWAINQGNRFTRLTCGGEQENNMKGLKGLQAMHKKSQKCYISRSCGGWTPGAIWTKFGTLVHMSTSSIQPSLITVTLLVWTWRGSKFSIFLCLTLRLIQQG